MLAEIPIFALRILDSFLPASDPRPALTFPQAEVKPGEKGPGRGSREKGPPATPWRRSLAGAFFQISSRAETKAWTGVGGLSAVNGVPPGTGIPRAWGDSLWKSLHCWGPGRRRAKPQGRRERGMRVVLPPGVKDPPGQQRKGESKCEGPLRRGWKSQEKPGPCTVVGGHRGRPEEEASHAQGIGAGNEIVLRVRLSS